MSPAFDVFAILAACLAGALIALLFLRSGETPKPLKFTSFAWDDGKLSKGWVAQIRNKPGLPVIKSPETDKDRPA